MHRQCTRVSNIQQSGCNFKIDLSFNLQGNGGNKITTLYVYNTADYNDLPANFYGQNNNRVPTSSELNNAKTLATIKINTDSILTVYNYQKVSNGFERPNSMQSGLSYSVDASSGQITIKEVSVTLANCHTLTTLRADVLSSQSPDLSSVGCIAKGVTFSPNEPIIRVMNKGCGASRILTTTFITTQVRKINFKAYKDVAPFKQFTAADTIASNAVSSPYTTTTGMNNNTGDYRSVGDYEYNVQNGEQFNVWVVAYTSDVPNVSVALATNTCAPLPTTFRSISAQRVKQNVLVKWETAMEENNHGFNVQRKVGNGEWQNVSFVASQAKNGSSANLLSYSSNDYNTAQGISQYRIQQVDINGKSALSEIRSVRSEEMGSKAVVYPNPSDDGKVTIAFETIAERNVIVSDVAGRVVKRFANTKDNTLVIENLIAGFYTIQIMEQATSSVSIEKVVVKRR
jgi:hypothetical protein